MKKCGGCGKFLAANETAKCPKCPGTFHRACVNLPVSGVIASTWLCPGCKAKIPREDNSQTPVKGMTTDDSSKAQPDTQTASFQDERDLPTTLSSLAMEIRGLRSEVNALRVEVRDFREEMSGLKDSVNKCSDRVDALECRVNIIEEKFEQAESPRFEQLEKTIGELKRQLNEREQETLLNDVQLTGVTETSGENPAQLVNILAAKLGTQLDERDVVFVKRVGNVLRNRVQDGEAPPRPRIIVVRLARRATRDRLLHDARVRRNLTTADIHVTGAVSRVYVNERLTKTNRQLFYMTRQAASRLGWKHVWTKDGRILARKEEGKSLVNIKSEDDIKRFFGSQ